MDVEFDAITQNTAGHYGNISNFFNMEYYHIESTSRTIYVIRSGVGTANAAMNLALTLNSLPTEAVILLGVGGARTNTLEPGSLVIAESVIPSQPPI